MKKDELQIALESAEDVVRNLKRLKGMQGPEQGLVGESRSDEATCPAEEAKPGERGVGEIVGADELRRFIERSANEAQLERDAHGEKEFPRTRAFFEGQLTALDLLRSWLSAPAEKRSDLTNDQVEARDQ